VGRGKEVVEGSPREQWLFVLMCAGLMFAGGVAFFLADDSLLRALAVLPAVVTLFLAYSNVMTARDNGATAREQALHARTGSGAPVVAMRIADVVPAGEADDAGYDVEFEFENFGSAPAVVAPGRPSLGHFREQGLVPLPPRGDGAVAVTCRLRLVVRIPAAQVEAERAGCREHRFGWPVTAPVTVHNLTRTVSDQLELSFRLEPFTRAPGGSWVRSPTAVEKDPGYGQLVRRLYREVPLEPAPPPKPERLSPARPAGASPGRTPSPRAPQGAGSRRP
jgi:hypothetical protein